MSSTAPFFLQQLTDNSGKPLSNGKLYSYVGGSTNLPKPIYYDKDYTTPCPNPLIADASGILPQYFMTSGYYKFEVRTAADVIIATRDYIDAGSGSGGGTADDHKVAVDQFDPTPAYLEDKIKNGVGTLARTIVGTDRHMVIDSKGYVATNAGDAHQNYLNQKLVGSKSVEFIETNIGTEGDPNWVMSPNINNKYGQAIPVWTILKTTDPTTAPFGLPQLDLEYIWEHHYGVAASELQTTDPGPGDLSVWYLEGGTYWGDATWVEKEYTVGQLILNANHGLYDYMTTFPEYPNTQWDYSNYPAGLYVLANDSSDGYLWRMQVVKQYPDPSYNVSSVLTYQSNNHSFEWIPNDSLTTDGTVRIDGFDSPSYLGYKIQAGSGISVVDTPNGVYGRFLKINATGSNPNGYGYACTMHVANATTVLAPNLIGLRNELNVLFVPFTDMNVTYNLSMFGCFLSQGGTGNLTFTLRDEQYRLIAASSSLSNPSPSVFLELVCALVQDPINQTPLTSYTLKMGNRYNLGISWTANGIQLLGDETNQNTNITPYPAYKVDNVTGGIIYQLTGGGESKMRPFIRLVTKES